MVPSDGLAIAIESNIFLSCPLCLIPVMSCLPCKSRWNLRTSPAPALLAPSCPQQHVPHQCRVLQNHLAQKDVPLQNHQLASPSRNNNLTSQPKNRTTVIETTARISTNGQIITPHRRQDGMPVPTSPQRHRGDRNLHPRRISSLRLRQRTGMLFLLCGRLHRIRPRRSLLRLPRSLEALRLRPCKHPSPRTAYR